MDQPGYLSEEVASRAGVEPGFVECLAGLGIVVPDASGRYVPGDVRRASMARALEEAGIALDDVADALRAGQITLAFLDSPAFERFASVAPETFREVAARTGVPLEMLTGIREALGAAEPVPDDRMREHEMAVVPWLELSVGAGFPAAGTERHLAVLGDSTRRIAESESAWWVAAVIEPAIAASRSPDEVANVDLAERTAALADQTLLALYHGHEARAWTADLIAGFEAQMAHAGIRSRLERLPAVCFLDISGYTQLTQDLGDAAAADLAGTVHRVVQRRAAQHGGKPIKWLGDGVMVLFHTPAEGVRAALEMVEELASAGLPPAHVGVHAGPVIFQQGDYFGQTVNLSARIADRATAGQVLVSGAVVTACDEPDLAFDEVGPVELKGVYGTVELLRARRR